MDWLNRLTIAAFVLVAACATPAPVRCAPAPLVAQADAEVVLEGTMEVLIEDCDQESRTVYFLVSGDRRVALRFPSRPSSLSTGTRVRVHGRWEKDNVLAVTAFQII